ncbi:MAG: hypothetical protein ABIA04_03955 [Pseudomonadota bacterium]
MLLKKPIKIYLLLIILLPNVLFAGDLWEDKAYSFRDLWASKPKMIERIEKANYNQARGGESYMGHFTSIFIMVLGSIISSQFNEAEDNYILYAFQEPTYKVRIERIQEAIEHSFMDLTFFSMFNGSIMARGGLRAFHIEQSLIYLFTRTGEGRTLLSIITNEFIATAYAFSFWEVIREWMFLAHIKTIAEIDERIAAGDLNFTREDKLELMNVPHAASDTANELKGFINKLFFDRQDHDLPYEQRRDTVTNIFIKHMIKIISEDSYRRLLIYNTFRKHMTSGRLLTLIGSFITVGYILSPVLAEMPLAGGFLARHGMVKGGLFGLLGLLLHENLPREIEHTIDTTIKGGRHLLNTGTLYFDEKPLENLLAAKSAYAPPGYYFDHRDHYLNEYLKERKIDREEALSPFVEFYEMLNIEIKILKHDIKMRGQLRKITEYMNPIAQSYMYEIQTIDWLEDIVEPLTPNNPTDDIMFDLIKDIPEWPEDVLYANLLGLAALVPAMGIEKNPETVFGYIPKNIIVEKVRELKPEMKPVQKYRKIGDLLGEQYNLLQDLKERSDKKTRIVQAMRNLYFEEEITLSEMIGFRNDRFQISENPYDPNLENKRIREVVEKYENNPAPLLPIFEINRNHLTRQSFECSYYATMVDAFLKSRSDYMKQAFVISADQAICSHSVYNSTHIMYSGLDAISCIASQEIRELLDRNENSDLLLKSGNTLWPGVLGETFGNIDLVEWISEKIVQGSSNKYLNDIFDFVGYKEFVTSLSSSTWLKELIYYNGSNNCMHDLKDKLLSGKLISSQQLLYNFEWAQESLYHANILKEAQEKVIPFIEKGYIDIPFKDWFIKFIANDDDDNFRNRMEDEILKLHDIRKYSRLFFEEDFKRVQRDDEIGDNIDNFIWHNNDWKKYLDLSIEKRQDVMKILYTQAVLQDGNYYTDDEQDKYNYVEMFLGDLNVLGWREEIFINGAENLWEIYDLEVPVYHEIEGVKSKRIDFSDYTNKYYNNMFFINASKQQ